MLISRTDGISISNRPGIGIKTSKSAGGNCGLRRHSLQHHSPLRWIIHSSVIDITIVFWIRTGRWISTGLWGWWVIWIIAPRCRGTIGIIVVVILDSIVGTRHSFGRRISRSHRTATASSSAPSRLLCALQFHFFFGHVRRHRLSSTDISIARISSSAHAMGAIVHSRHSWSRYCTAVPGIGRSDTLASRHGLGPGHAIHGIGIGVSASATAGAVAIFG